MFRAIDWAARRVIAWPLVFPGLVLTSFAKELIILGSWIADIPIEEELK